jgi:hypothetical protein
MTPADAAPKHCDDCLERCERCAVPIRTKTDNRAIYLNKAYWPSEIDPDVCQHCGYAIVEACLAYEANNEADGWLNDILDRVLDDTANGGE